MNAVSEPSAMIENVFVPDTMISNPEGFGGIVVAGGRAGDLVVKNGIISKLLTTNANPDRRLVLPKLTECHVHLDKCHTVDRLEAVGGDLTAAIEAQAKDRQNWTEEDLRYRANKGLEELAASGCHVVRSHVDWSYGEEATTPPLSWHILNELSEAHSDITLQVAPLVSVDIMADRAVAEVIAKEIASKNGVLGVFVLGQSEREEGIRNAFDLAENHGLSLDFHVDEDLNPDLDGLEIIADMALETKFQGPILCGHCCSLASKPLWEFKRVADKLRRAGIFVTALPATNLYLQGRNDGTPDRRGLTKIKELKAAGVPVIVGTDNVCDAFCPIGAHDPRRTLAHAILSAHLDPPIQDHLPMITTDAEKALGLEPTYVDGAKVQNLLIFETASLSEFLSKTDTPSSLDQALNGVVK